MKENAQEKTGKEWLTRETRPYRASVFFLAVLSVVVTLFSLAFAYLVRYLINSASEGSATKLWIFSGILIGVLLLKIIFKTVNTFLAERLRTKMYANLRTKTFSKILRANYACTQGYHSGDLLNRLTADVQEVTVDTVGLLPALVGMAVQCLGAIAALLTIDPLFTAIYVVGGCVLGGLTALFRRQIKKRHKEVMETDGKARSFIQEGLSSMTTVKAYSVEEKATEKLKNLSDTYYDKRMKRNVLRSEMSFIFSLLSNFGLIFAVVWSSISVLKGSPDYGSILSVILLLMQLQQPLTSFSSLIPVYYSRTASAERLAELDDLPVDEQAIDKAEVPAIYNNMQSIRLEKLSFSYGRDSVLKNADIVVNKGEIVCLTGASGAGKSTIFKLLLSVFQPTDGKILFEGNFEGSSISITARERSLFAYVPQGNFLFSGTIAENLAFFADDSDLSDEEIRKALDIACAEFVYTLPEGLQTKLNEGGEGLSEGQLQRLNIARALLSHRPILLLDEATSALDGETEERLLQNIRSLQDKTCLIVTHRPAALAVADRIFTVEKGQITQINE